MRRHPVATELVQLVSRDRRRFAPQLDDGEDLLAPSFIGDSDHRGLGYRGMREEQLLDLARIDVQATADDHVLQPAGHPQVATLVHRADVTHVQPAISVDRAGRCIGHLVVAQHVLVPATADLTLLADRHRNPSGGIGDLDLELLQRATDRFGLIR